VFGPNKHTEIEIVTFLIERLQAWVEKMTPLRTARVQRSVYGATLKVPSTTLTYYCRFCRKNSSWRSSFDFRWDPSFNL